MLRGSVEESWRWVVAAASAGALGLVRSREAVESWEHGEAERDADSEAVILRSIFVLCLGATSPDLTGNDDAGADADDEGEFPGCT